MRIDSRSPNPFGFFYGDITLRRYLIFGLLSIFISLFFLKCAIKDPVVPDAGKAPVVESITAPESIDLTNMDNARVSAHVTDPQGYETISHVLLSVKKGEARVSRDTLRDDGLHGDILVRDGRFSLMLEKNHFQTQSGVFSLEVQAFDTDGHESIIQSDSIFAFINPPVLSDLILTDPLNEETLSQARFSVQVVDDDGQEDIDSVWCELILPRGSDPFIHFEFVDDGTSGDASPDDGIFSRQIDLSDTIRIPGPYEIQVQASDSKGSLSQVLIDTVRVDLPNDPPVLTDLNAPSTIDRETAGPMILTVQVNDPQGRDDVWRVFFNVTKPDSTPSSGNPFLMYDDGNLTDHGDETAGDGTYSIIIQISTSNDPGVYQFEFLSEDRNGALSESLIHFIDVE